MNAWIGNLFGIGIVRAGTVESRYPTSIGRPLKIQTNLERRETRVFFDDSA